MYFAGVSARRLGSFRDEMNDEKKGFTVKDRRLFTAEGELRPVDAEDARPPEPARPSEPAPVERPKPSAEPSQPAASTGRVSERPPSLFPGEVSFGSFLMSLAAQAGALLDEGQDAGLAGARQIISILEMLQDKTDGRRSAEEEQILGSLLYELRMAYVERARMARA